MARNPFWLLISGFGILPKCSTSSARKFRSPPTSSPTCGGFFDVAKLNHRFAELEAQMSGETFWNNQEAAQKVINETNDIRGKLEPLARFGKQVEDLQVMLELGQAEPETVQTKIEAELEADTKKLFAELDTFELKTFLSGPHDKCNCIFTINAGAGGTEAQDWAEMLSRMYGRWFDSRGWKWEVTDALQGDTAGLKPSPSASKAKTPTVFARPNAACTGSCASRRSIPTSAATRVFPAWTRWRN